MRIATWNVNSIKAHMEAVTRWLAEAKPDVVCLQEIKCEDAGFPALEIEALGYTAAVHGQKTYNGVAILSRLPMEDVRRGLPGDSTDEQSRFISALIMDGARAVRVASIYLPNGNPAPGPKYDYKLSWMERLKAHALDLLKDEEPLVITGDYNVIPAARDAKNPSAWVADALFLPQTRAAFAALTSIGLTEAFRALHPLAEGVYTFWDYQAGAWQKNNGIRIDHALLSPQAADLLVAAEVEAHVRGWDKPSDHVPLVITLR
ncbi:MAG: exodeoxyribonuclease III [Hyphomicrobiales bacterium]